MDDTEKKKVRQLMQEKQKDGGTIDWMYKGDKPEMDDYLLGKRVDKFIEKQEETKPEDDIGAIFSDRVKANLALDMQAKAREDPLFAIRKREEDMRRELLNNPVKMKRLQQTRKREKMRKEEKRSVLQRSNKDHSMVGAKIPLGSLVETCTPPTIAEKQKKAKKKDGKHRKDSSDSEDEILNKYFAILNQKHKTDRHHKKAKKRKHHRHDDSEDSDNAVKQDRTDYRNKHNRDLDKHLKNDGHKHRKDFDHSCKSKHKKESDQYYRHAKESEHSHRSKRRIDSDCSDNESYHKHKHSRDKGMRSSSNKNSKHSESSDSCDGFHQSKSSKHKDRTKESYRYDNRKVRSQSDDSSSEESDEEIIHSSAKNRHQSSKYRQEVSSDEDDGQLSRKAYGLIKGKNYQKRPAESSDRNTSRSPPRKSKSSKGPTEKSRSPRRSKSPRRSRSPRRRSRSPRRRSKSPKAPVKVEKPRKLTADEKQKKLEEMMENAKWRDDQRKSNVRRYAEEERNDAERERKSKGDGADFLNPMMANHASKSSLEDRLKRNKYNIQRTRADLARDPFKK